VAGVTRTLAVDLGGGFVMPTPVMIASGCAGSGRELAALVDLHKVGAIVTRTITVRPQKGSPPPRIAESPSGIVWSTGGQNPGIETFIREELPKSANPAAVVVSIGGGTLDEYVAMASLLRSHPSVAAIEVNLLGVDEELGREEMGAHPDRAAEIAAAVARLATVPVFAKIPIHSREFIEVAVSVARSGVHGLTLGGPPPAAVVDAQKLKPALGPVIGWLSGAAVKPLTLRAVIEVARALPATPILAVGGIRSGLDAVECMLAGAWAVQVGTATLVDPSAPIAIAQGVARFIKEKGFSSPKDLRGRLRLPESQAAGASS
jgi:dihydroorotate dehydrogenase (NAD+) catalytic subunit